MKRRVTRAVQRPGPRRQTRLPDAGSQRGGPWLWCLPIAAVCAASAPVVFAGFPQGHDWIFELVRSAQYAQALRAGQWPPAWASELYGGYGSPIFLFYAPLFLAASALGGALLGSVQAGCCAVLACLPALAALAVAAMVRQLPGAPPAAARAAAGFYVLHPYLLGDAWLRNANAEYTALCLAPIGLAGLLRAPREPLRAVLWISAGLAAVILAHNLSALWLAGLCAGATLLRLAEGRAGRRAAGAGVAGIALGLALAAFFWPAALLGSGAVRSGDLLLGKFDFHGNFPAPGELFGWGRFFGAGPLTAALPIALAAVAALARPRLAERGSALALCAAAALCALLATRISVGLWDRAPLLAFYQFPWRLAGPLALLAALALGWLVREASARWGPGAVLGLELAVFALVALQALPRLLEFSPLPAAQHERFERALAPQALLRSPLPATVGDEYLPRGADLTAWQLEPRRDTPWIDAGSARLELLEDRGVRARVRVAAASDTALRWARWDFPHWTLARGGEALALERTAQGALLSRVPAGEYELELRYQPPLARRAGLAVSALALLGWLGLALRARR